MPDTVTQYKSEYQAYFIQKGDILDITVKSLSKESVSVFEQTNTSTGNVGTGANMLVRGYVVDDSGNVKIPLIGKVNVHGKTLIEADSILKAHLEDYFNIITVNTKLLSYRITILGEVNSPGNYAVYNQRNSLFNAIGLAGDLTDFANRKNVKLIRHSDTNYKAVIIDLTSKDLIQNKFFYLQPGDVIYVEPLTAKTFKMNTSSISFVFSAVTFVAVMINLIRQN
jgi:polysaccharide export outer membrane protein